MSIPTEIAADLAELEAEMLQTFTWNGSDYPCMSGSARRGKRLGSGGFMVEADLVLFVRTSHFSEDNLILLKSGAKNRVTFDDHDYRIEDVVTPQGQPFLKLLCNDTAQRS